MFTPTFIKYPSPALSTGMYFVHQIGQVGSITPTWPDKHSTCKNYKLNQRDSAMNRAQSQRNWSKQKMVLSKDGQAKIFTTIYKALVGL